MKSGDHDEQSEPRHGSWHVHAVCPLTPWPLSGSFTMLWTDKASGRTALGS